MALAGTPSDLTTRPAISGSSGPAGLWRALLVVTITVAVVMATSFIVGSKAANGGPASDRSYDQIEQLRGGANFSATSADHSYDQIEQLRGGVTFVDPRFDDIQTLRGTLRGTTLVTGTAVDHR